MKYNKSKIMSRAWQLKRCNSYYTFGKCLHIAWNEAKRAICEAEQQANVEAQKGQIYRKGMEITVNYNTYSLNRWTNYGKDRIYVNRGANSIGYLDVSTGRITTTARKLSSEAQKALEIVATLKVA